MTLSRDLITMPQFHTKDCTCCKRTDTMVNVDQCKISNICNGGDSGMRNESIELEMKVNSRVF